MPDTVPPAAEPAQPKMPEDPYLDELPPSEPPMRVVTKGWWVWREELVPREVLEAEDREADRKRATRFSLKSLIFGRG
jgi:hypothetical protein